MARPQVHGYDLNCLTLMPNHRFASGADEKLVRVFDATKNFLDNVSAITGHDFTGYSFSDQQILSPMNYDLFGLGEARAISAILQSCFT